MRVVCPWCAEILLVRKEIVRSVNVSTGNLDNDPSVEYYTFCINAECGWDDSSKDAAQTLQQINFE